MIMITDTIINKLILINAPAPLHVIYIAQDLINL